MSLGFKIYSYFNGNLVHQDSLGNKFYQDKKNPNKNYIGVDIKGARFWEGAKLAQERNIKNVAFLRTQIELLNYCFVK